MMMLTKPRFSPRTIKALVPIVLTVLLCGCSAGPSSVASEIKDSRDFIFVQTGEQDSYETLARRYYGSAALSGMIRRINKDRTPSPGMVVAVPKRTLNPSGVYPDGYRTIPILCYHRFTTSQTSNDRLELPVSQFRQQLQYLTDNGYYVISLDKLSQYLLGNREIPEKSVVLTMDDGYQSVYTIAYPLFTEFSMPATLFVYTDFVGAPLAVSWEQVEAMQRSGLIDIQSHSKSHTSLVTPADETVNFTEAIRHQIHYPKTVIERKLNKPSDIFSYPYGDSSDQAIEELAAQGITMSVTVQQGGNPAFANPYLLKRTMIYADDSMKTFADKLDVFHAEDFQ